MEQQQNIEIEEQSIQSKIRQCKMLIRKYEDNYHLCFYLNAYLEDLKEEYKNEKKVIKEIN